MIFVSRLLLLSSVQNEDDGDDRDDEDEFRGRRRMKTNRCNLVEKHFAQIKFQIDSFLCQRPRLFTFS